MTIDFRQQLQAMRIRTLDDSEVRKREEQAQHEATARDAARRAAQRSTRLEASGLALDDRSRELIVQDTALPTDAIRAVRSWLSGTVPTLFLLGGTGTGKTTAAGLAIALRGGTAVKARTLVRRFASTWSTESDRWERMIEAPLLVVDELGTETGEHAAAALLEVVDERQSVRRRTVWLSNLDRASARARFDQRALSRLERDRARWLELPPMRDMRARGR